MNNFKWIYLIIPIGIIVLIFSIKILLPLQKTMSSYGSQACNFSGCHISIMNLKYNYWLSQAIEKRDPNLCNNVEGYDNGDYQDSKELAVYFCKARYGGGITDASYCLSLENTVKYKGTATQQYVCFREMLKTVSDANDCDKFPTNTYPISPKFECYSEVAKKSNNADLCNKIPEKGYDRNHRGSKKSCLISIGRSLKETKVCSQLTEEWVVDECISAISSN